MITIYTTPDCPRCKILKTKLEQAGIEYQESQNIENIISKGFENAPVLQIDKNSFLDMKQAINWIKEEK